MCEGNYAKYPTLSLAEELCLHLSTSDGTRKLTEKREGQTFTLEHLIKMFFSVALILFTASNSMAIDSSNPLRDRLSDYGLNVQKTFWGRILPILVGDFPIPQFRNGGAEKLADDLTRNVLAPGIVETNFRDLDFDEGKIKKSFENELQLQQEFNALGVKLILSGEVYNIFSSIRTQLYGCPRRQEFEINLEKTDCNHSIRIALAIFNIMYVNRHLKGLDAWFQLLFDDLLTHLTLMVFPEPVSIGLEIIQYSISPKILTLKSIGNALSSDSMYFKKNLGELKKLQSRRPDLSETPLYDNIKISTFRNAVELLSLFQSSGNQTPEYNGEAAKKVQLYLNDITKLLERPATINPAISNKFTVHEFYSGLGILSNFYSSESNYVDFDKVRVARGGLRSVFKELTDSTFERKLLGIWGYFTSYGTAIGFPTLVFGIFFVVVFALCFVSKSISINPFSLSALSMDTVETTLRIFTIRGKPGDLFCKSGIDVLTIETLLFVYIPTYFAYLVTFLLRNN